MCAPKCKNAPQRRMAIIWDCGSCRGNKRASPRPEVLPADDLTRGPGGQAKSGCIGSRRADWIGSRPDHRKPVGPYGAAQDRETANSVQAGIAGARAATAHVT